MPTIPVTDLGSQSLSQVEKFRASYEQKCRAADEAEDDARFAPVENSVPSTPVPAKQPFKENGTASSASPTPASDAASVPAATAAHAKEPSSEEVEDMSADPLDPEKLKRRETLREQFGFERRRESARKSSSGAHSDGGQGSLDGSTLAPTTLGDESTTSVASQSSTSSAGNGNSNNGGAYTGLKRSGTLSTVLSRVERVASTSPIVSNIRAAVSSIGEPKHIRLRKESQNAEEKYRTAVEKLDRLRAELEEVVMEHLELCQKWEGDRHKAVKAGE